MSVRPACGADVAAHPLDAAVPGEADAVADALAEAFEGYPWTDWITPADGRRERLHGLHLLTVAEVGLPFGEVWVVRCPATSGPRGRRRSAGRTAPRPAGAGRGVGGDGAPRGAAVR